MLWSQISVPSDLPVSRRSPQNVVFQLLQGRETLKSFIHSALSSFTEELNKMCKD